MPPVWVDELYTNNITDIVIQLAVLSGCLSKQIYESGKASVVKTCSIYL